MIKRKRRRPVKFIEPTNIFEQLEERVVLDASIAFTGDQTVNEDQQLQWSDADVEAPSEGDAGFEYSLEIDVDGVGVGQDPVSLDDFNNNVGDVRRTSDTPALSQITFDQATGELTWTPDNRDVGTYDFIINSGDGAGDTDQVVAEITVNNVQPIITTLAETTFTEDVSGQTFDVDSTDEIYGVTYSLVDGPDTVTDWLEIDSSTGVISVTSGAPTDAQVGTWEFFVRVNDGTGSGDVDQAFILTIENTMDFDTADSASVDEDDAFLFDVDTDTEEEGIAVKYSLVDGTGSVPSWLSIDQYTGVITGNPDNSDVNPAGYVFAVLAERDDGVVESEQQTFTLYVNNTDPEFLNVEQDIYLVESSGDQTFDVETSDEEVPAGLDGYTLVAFDDATFDPSAPVENPASIPGWLTIDGDTGIVHGDPANVDVGDHFVWVKFDDGNGGVVYERFEVHVDNIDLYFTSPDQATWVEDAAGQTFEVNTSEEGDGVTYSLDITDPLVAWDGNPLTYRHPVLDLNWFEIDATTGTVTALVTPDNEYVGVYTFDILADEGHGDPAIVQQFMLTVVNTVPVIVSADVTTVQEDTSGNTFQVLLQNAEPGATYSISSNPSIGSGTVQIDENTGIITIPDPTNADVGGVYVFNIIVDDHNGGTATMFFEIQVTNSTPVFTNLPTVGGSGLPTILVQEDHVSTFSTVDTDDEGDGTTTYSIVSGLAGVSIDSATGLITVNAGNIEVGQHTITIQFDDGTSLGETGVITQDITIDVTNYEPHITSVDNVTWVEDAGYFSFDVESDDEGQGSVTYSLGAGAPDWLIEGVNFDVNTGVMSLVPENEHVGYWEFTITVNDGNTAVDSQLFHLTVTNDPPIFVTAGEAYFNVNGGTQTFDVHTDDENSDRDPASSYPVDANTYRLDGAPTGVSIDEKTGVISWDGVSSGQGDYTFDIEFYDGSVWIDQSFTLYITDTPPGGADHTAGFFSANNTTMLEDEPNQEFDIEYIDEGTAGYEYRLDGTQPAGLTIDAATGVITWSPTNDDVTLPIDGTGYAFDIDIVDANNGNAVVATEHFTLHVQNVVPWWGTPALTVTFTEDTAAGDQPTYNVDNTDEGHGDETEYSLVDGTDSVPYWLSIDDTGRIYVDAAKITDAEDKLRNDDVGTWNIQVKFDDGHGGVIYQDVTVVVENVLTFLNASTFTWQEDSTTAFTFDADTDDDSYYAVTYSISDVPTWLEGHYTFDTSTGEFATDGGFAPDNTIPGRYTFTISADDGKGGSSQTITLTVPNRDPVFAETEFDMYEDDGSDTINLQGDDELQGDTYYTWSGAPQWMSLDPITGEITADPTNEHVGTYMFQVTQYDLNAEYDYGLSGIDGYTTETITVTVHNRDPELESGLSDTVEEDSSWTYNLQYDDEGVDGTTYSLDPADAAAYPWISIDEDTGVLTAHPTNANVGTFEFDIIVDDQHGGIVTDTFTLEVTNRAPEFQNPPGSTYTITVTEDTVGNIFDLLTDDEGQHNLNSPPSTGNVYYYIDPAASALVQEFVTITDAEDGILEINPTNRHVGTHTFSIFVDDGNPGGVTEMVITLVVKNTAPRYTTPNAIIWYEDLSTDIPFDVNTTDEPGNQDHDRPTPVIEYSLIQTGDDISFLYIDPKTGEMAINVEDTQNQSGANAGSPDNSLVGVYEFIINFFDGTKNVQQLFTLTINNSKTDFPTTPLADQTFTEGVTLTIEETFIQAIDEYNVNNIVVPGDLTDADDIAAYLARYDIDYYELYIDLDYQNAGLIRVDNGTYNSSNDAWGGGDITFDTTTGEIIWTPTNADVPDTLGLDGNYHHRFVVRHYDGHGTMDETWFFVEVVNVSPTIGDVNDWILVEDANVGDSTHPQDTDEWMTTTQVGVTYELEWSSDGITYVKWTDDDQPNGAEGGIIIFDDDTGDLIWQVTNADVTESPYTFRIRADDGTPNETEGAADSRYSAWDYFDVTVQNVTTAFDEVPSAPTNTSVTEDSEFTFDFQANDELSEASGVSAGDNGYTYYELDIDDDGDDSDGYDWHITNQTELDAYLAANGLRSDDMTFDFHTGEFAWTPNHADVIHPDEYKFQVTHYDGHGTDDSVTFAFTVDNVPPDVDLPSGNNWILTEDDTTENSTLDITSDDDSYTGDESFAFYFWSPTVDLDGQGAIDVDGDGDLDPGWEAVGDLSDGDTGIRPNGPDGGLLAYDSSTLELVWVTTNEDVTYNEDGSQGPSYRMLVIATDGYIDNNPSWEEFDVEVVNADTEIDTVNAPSSDPDNPQTGTQDSLFVVLGEDDATTDPYIEANDEYDDYTDFPADDRYELWIDDNDQIVQASLDDLTGLIKWDDWAASTGGAAITFNEKTGEIQWTPGNLDVPNILDAETGTYYHHEFVIRHIDGHGSEDFIHFYVELGNVTPTLDPDPSTLPDPYSLVEDTTTLSITDADIGSSEEGQGLTYYLQIWRDANGDDTVQESEWVTINDGDRINTRGGQFDLSTGNFAETGAFTWTPTNADVTIDESGSAFLAPYKFRITGNDNTPNSGDSWISNPYVFDVTVDNDPTNITSPSNLPTQPDGDITEDTSYSWNFGSKDQRTESGNLDDFGLVHDSYFELKVDGVSVFTAEPYDPSDRYYDFTPTVDGGEITFDKEAGIITWTPNDADVTKGSYSFEMIHYDGHGSSASTTFTVTVNNRAPQIVVPGDTNLIEDENAADGDPVTGYQIDIGSDDEVIEGVDYLIEIFDGGSWHDAQNYVPNAGGGTITYDTDTGIITWETTNADVTTNPDGSASAPYQFRVTATDEHGGDSLYTQVPFTVTVSNAETSITDIADQTLTEDTAWQIPGASVDALDENVGGGFYTLTVQGYADLAAFNAGRTGANVLTIDAVTGQIDWTPTDADVGLHTFVVTHDDNHGDTKTDTFTVTVENKVPEVVVPADTNLIEDENAADGDPATGYQIDIWSHDELVAGVDYVIEIFDGGSWHDAQGYTPNAGGGTITYDTDTGVITWETTNADVTTNPDGSASAPYQFRVTVTDEHGGDSLLSDATFSVTVSNAETSITDIADQTLTEDTAWQIPGASVDALDEAVGGGFYTLTVQGYADLAAFNAGRTGSNVLTIDSVTGQIDWTPTDADLGNYVFEITHDDNHGDTKTDTFAVTVNNRAPQVVVPADTNLIEDENAADGDPVTGYQIDIWSDDEVVAGVDYVIEIFDGGSWHDAQNYTPNVGGGTITYDTDTGIITWETTNADVTTNPDGSASAPYEFRVRATDEHGGDSLFTQAMFDVTVSNDPTDIRIYDPGTNVDHTTLDLTEDVAYTLPGDNVESRDEDLDGSYYMLRIQTGGGAWETLSEFNTGRTGANILTFDSTTGEFTWTANNLDVGDYVFEFTHNDQHGSTAVDTVNVVVDNVKPTLDPISPNPWELIEDAGAGASTLDQSGVNSSDEGVGVTYELQYWIDGSNGGTANGVVEAVEWNTITTGYEPNGTEGGEIIFDDTNGQIVWQTTNADVTIASDADGNALIRDPYLFRIQADDGNDDGTTDDHLSGWQEFEVTVENVTTLITNTPAGGVWNITEDPNPVPDGVTPITVNEFDIQANDEEVESTTFSFNAYYDLYIDAGSGEDLWSEGEGPNTAAGGSAVVFDTDTGIISWDANDADVGSYAFRVVHHDGHGEDAETTFTVNVGNRAPQVVVPADTNLIEDENAADGDPVTGYQIDIGSDDEVIAGVDYLIEIFDGGSWHDAQGYTPNAGGGTITYDADTGIITWETTNADVTTNPDGSASAPYQFRVTATDDHGVDSLFTQVPFTVTVSNAETSITDIADQTLTEDTAWQIAGAAVDALDENVGGGFYTLTVQGYADLAAFNAGRTGANVLTVDSVTGQIDWTPTDADVGNYVFEITHDDNHGDTKTDTFAVTVDNKAPEVVVPADTNLIEDENAADGDPVTGYQIDIWSHDELVAGVDYVIEIFDGGSWHDAQGYTPNAGGGTITYDADTGIITWETTNADVTTNPDGSASAPYQFRVTATDDHGVDSLFTQVPFTVTVSNAETSITDIADQTLTEDTAWQIAGAAVDALDENVGGGFYTLTVQGYADLAAFNAGRTGANVLTVDSVTGQIDWTPTDADVGNYVFEITHDDNHGDTKTDTFAVTVNNRAPQIVVPGDTNLIEDENAADGDPVTGYQIDIGSDDEVIAGVDYLIEIFDGGSWHDAQGYTPNAGGGTITYDADTGIITWETTNADVTTNPDGSASAPYQFRVTATDDHGVDSLFTQVPFTVTVSNAETSITDIADQTLTEDTAWQIAGAAVDALDENVGGGFYTLTVQGYADLAAFNAGRTGANVLTVDSVTGQIDWTPTDADVGNYVFEITHDDNHGDTKTDTFAVTVDNKAPEVVVPADTNLIEDENAADGDPVTGYQIDIWSHDELVAGVDYVIEIFDGGSWHDAQGYTPNAGGGTITYDADTGIITWETTNADVTTNPDGSASAPYQFRVTATDDHGVDSLFTQVPFTVTVSNAETSITDIADQTLTEDTAWQIAGAAVDALDENVGGGFYTLTVQGYADLAAFNAGRTGANVLTVDSVTGQIDWTPTDADVGNYVFEITHDDNHGDTKTDTFAVTVNNRAPQIVVPGDTNLIEDENAADGDPVTGYQIDVGSDDEVIAGVDYVIEIFDGGSWHDAQGYTPNAGGGTITYDTDTGIITWETTNADVTTNPDGSASAPYDFRVTATDDHGVDSLFTQVPFTVTVSNAETSITDIADQTLTEDTAWQIAGAAVDALDENVGGGFYTLTVQGYADLAAFNAGRTGANVLTVDSVTGQIDWTPTDADVGNYVFEITHDDNHGDTKTDTFAVTVDNKAPEVVVPADTNLIEDENAADGDPVTGYQIDIWSHDELVAGVDYVIEIFDGGSWHDAQGYTPNAGGGTITYDADTGIITWETTNADVTTNPDGSASAPYQFRVTATDDHGVDSLFTQVPFTVTVSNAETSITDIADQTLTEDTAWQIAGAAVDALDENVGGGFYTLTVQGYADLAAFNAGRTGANVLTVDSVTGQIDWTPTDADVGNYVFEITHDDNHGDTKTDTFAVTVNNRAPQIVVPGDTNLIEDENAADGDPVTGYQINIGSDDEVVAGVDYLIEIFDGGSWHDAQGYTPNAGGGTITYDTDTGIITWETTNADVTTNPDGSASAPYDFRVTATDDHGVDSLFTQVPFTVTVSNAETSITDIADQTLTEDTAWQIAGAAVDALDENVGGGFYTLTVQGYADLAAFNAGRTGANVLTVDSVTGQIDWTPTDADVGNYVFEITHDDNHGDTKTDTFAVTVDNKAPEVVVPADTNLIEDENAADGDPVTGYQIDIWSHDELVAGVDYVIEIFDGGSWHDAQGYTPNAGGGTITYDTDTGVITWETTNADVTTNPDGSASAPYQFRVTATDDHGVDSLFTQVPFTVTVSNAETSITDIADQTLTEDTAWQIAGAAVDALDENVGGGFYTLTVQGYADLAAFNAGRTGANVLSVDSVTGQIDWAPTDADVGNYVFEITHDDNHGDTKTDTFAVTVNNRAPQIVVPGDTNLIEDENAADGDPVTGYQINIGSDDEVVAGVDYLIEIFDGGSWHDAQGYTPNAGGGTITYDTDTGVITWETTNADVTTNPDGSASAPYQFRVTATDDHGVDSLFTQVPFTVTVSNAETSITDIADQTLTEDTAWQIAGAAVDALDENVGGGFYTLTVQGYADLAAFNAGRTGANVLTVDSVTGQIDWTPTDADVGNYVFEITHDDNHGDTKTDTFAVTVDNKAPEVVVPADTNLIEDENAADGDPVTGYQIDIWSHDELVAGVDYVIEIFDGGSWHDAQGYTPNAGGGTITYDADTGIITWETTNADVTTNPDGSASAPYQFRVTATDDHGVDSLFTQVPFTVTVSNAETSITDIADQTLTEDTAWQIAGAAVDALDENVGGGFYTLTVQGYADLAAFNAGRTGANVLTVDSVTGQIDWTPTDADVGNYVFEITHDDNHGDTKTDTFAVTVDNKAPEVVVPADTNLIEDENAADGDPVTGYQIDIWSHDELVAGVDYVIEIFDGGSWHDAQGYTPNAGGGTITYDTDTGVITWETTNADVTTNPDGSASAPYQFRVTATDDHGVDSLFTQVPFTVTVSNAETSITDIADQTLTEDTAWQIAGAAVDALDENVGGGFYTLTVQGYADLAAFNAGRTGANVLTVDSVTGQIDWTPTDADVGNYVFEITHDDNHGDTKTDTFAVTVDNKAPEVVVPADTNLIEDENAADGDPVTGYQIDIWSHDELVAGVDYVIEIFDGGSWHDAQGYTPNAGGGTITYDADTGIITWETTNADVTTNPDGSASAPYQFRVTATDDHGVDSLFTQVPFTVTVSNAETSITDIADQTLTEDTAWQIAGAAVDALDENVGGGFYTLTVQGYADLAAFNAGRTGANVLTVDSVTGQIDWTPTDADVGNYVFEITHDDNHGDTKTDTFAVTVDNKAPEVVVPADTNLIEDENAADGDPVTGYQIDIWSHDELVAGVDYVIEIFDGGSWHDAQGYTPNAGGGTITYDTDTGVITWETTNADVTTNPDGSASAPYQFRVTATDDHGVDSLFTQVPFTVTVSNAETSITDIADQTLTEDTAWQIAGAAVDALDENVGGGFYTLTVQGYADLAAFNAGRTGANVLSVDSVTGQIDWTPDNLDVGSYVFEITHDDNHGDTKTDTFAVTVENVAPTITAPTQKVLVEDSTTADEYTLDESEIESSDEGVGVTYEWGIWADDGDGVIEAGEVTQIFDGHVFNAGGGAFEFTTATDGGVVWHTTNADVTYDIDGNYTGPYEIVVRANDGNTASGNNYSEWANVDFIVENAETVIDPIADQTATEDVEFHLFGDTSDAGYSAGDPYAYATDEQIGAGTFYTLYIDRFNSGTFESISDYNEHNGLGEDIDLSDFNTLTGELTWTPNNADVGTHEFMLVHNDAHGDTDSETFLVTVQNSPVTLTVPAEWNLTEDDTNPADYTLPDSAIEASDEDQGAIYYLKIDGVDAVTGYRPNGDEGGAIYFDPVSGEIQWQTTNADVGTGYEFEITVVDTNGDWNTEIMIVNVHNDPTSINDIPDQTVTEDGMALNIGDGGVTAKDEGVGGAFYTLEIERVYPDGTTTPLVDVGDYNAGNGEGSDIFFDPETGEIIWDTTNRDVGEYNFVVTHDDIHGSTATDTFHVTVLNDSPKFMTDPPADYIIVPATLNLTYDPGTDDEAQHDALGWDQVTYSLTSCPSGMSIDPMTGMIDWTAPAYLAGQEFQITIMVEDGNGGYGLQSFMILVDATVQDIPWEAKFPYGNFHGSERPDQGENPLDEGNPPKEPKLEFIPENIPLKIPSGDLVEELLGNGEESRSILEQLHAGGKLVQPSLEPGGTVVSPTKLWGFLADGLNGRRLDFNLEEIELWNDLRQPTEDIGGSQSPDTPLEGFAPAVESGKRLNFDFFPIEEVAELDLEGLKVSDLLDL